jgi:hypothetical protein
MWGFSTNSKENERKPNSCDWSMVALTGTSPHSEAVLAFRADGASGAVATGFQSKPAVDRCPATAAVDVLWTSRVVAANVASGKASSRRPARLGGQGFRPNRQFRRASDRLTPP